MINVSGASVAHVTPRLCVDGVGEALEQLSRRRRGGAGAKVVAGRNAVGPDASQAVPPPRSLPRAAH